MKNIFTALMILISLGLSVQTFAQDSLKILDPLLAPDQYDLLLNGQQLLIENGAYIIEQSDVITGTNEIVIQNADESTPLNGISTLDYVLIFRGMILGFEENLEVVASDFDGDMAVSTKDIVEIRRYILGLESEALYPNYKIIDPDFVFPSDFGPFNMGIDFTKYYFEDTELGGAPLTASIIKSGDVNGSAQFAPDDVPVSRASAVLSYPDVEVMAGENYEVEFTLSSSTEFQGSSFGLLTSGISISSIQENGHDLLYKIQDASLKLSYFTDHPEKSFSYSMEFVATKDGKLSELINMDTEFLREVVDILGSEGGVSLSANVVSGTQEIVDDLFTISPNPVRDILNIRFDDSGSNATKNIQLFSLDGKLVINEKINSNTYSINIAEINAKGQFVLKVTYDGKLKVEKVLIH